MANLGLQNKNPGNLKDPKTGQFRVFNTPEEGEQALIEDLKIKQSGQSKHIKPGASISDLANVWAPASDNNKPSDWASNVSKALGVKTAMAFDQIPPEQLAQGIKVAEGTSQNKPTQQPQLSRDQMIENINAMEQQGAKPDEIQSYLNSLKGKQNKPASGGYITSNPIPSQLTQPQGEPKEQGFLGGVSQDIGERLGQAGEAISGVASGKTNILSGALRVGGAAGGAIGDVTSRALESIPIVGSIMKGLEGAIGFGIGKLMETKAGQSVAQSVAQWAKENPEQAKDAGALFNIVTAVPILKGLGVVKNIAADTVAVALRKQALKGVTKDLSEVGARAGVTRDIMAKVPDVAETIAKHDALPNFSTIEGVTRYETQAASKTMGQAIGKLDDELDTVINTTQDQAEAALKNQYGHKLAYKEAFAKFGDKSSLQSLESLKQDALKIAKEELKPTQGIENVFARIESQYGTHLSLKEVNQAKRLISKQISDAAFGDPEVTVNKAVRSALQKGVENGAKKLGRGNAVEEVNKRMAKLIQAQDFLDAINGKTVKSAGGLGHQIVRGAATAGGAALGGLFGSPMVGGLVGYGATGYLEKKLGGLVGRGLRENILKRSAKGATRQSPKQIRKATTGLVGGIAGQKATR